MKVNDTVYHKVKKQIGIVREIGRRCAFVNWSDHTGVCFRWAKLTDLEVI
jgi:hypothetical protein